MKINSRFFNWRLPAGSLVTVCWLFTCFARGQSADFIAHEWGTFTSVQGADGVLLDWQVRKSSQLPGFVYDWHKAAPSGQAVPYSIFDKNVMYSLQRMETPVIYFYSDRAQTVDVTVDFPEGTMTEWYPRMSDAGRPTTVSTTTGQAVAGPTTATGNQAINPKRLHWGQLRIRPSSESATLARALRTETSGSHYFTARATDANYLQTEADDCDGATPETEKFLFYRGVGRFATPLRVTVDASDAVIVTNAGPEKLDHLMVLSVQNGAGTFTVIDQLGPGDQWILPKAAAEPSVPPGKPGLPGIEDMSGTAPPMPVAMVEKRLTEDLAAALVREGLYQREAKAMVNTWKDSWFDEDGVRVLYVLPRAWTDRTLPLRMKPTAREVVRVMLGRAEVLSPALERRLSAALRSYKAGDAAAGEQVLSKVNKLGRFAEPALQLAVRNFSQNEMASVRALLQPAAAAANAK